MISNCDISSLHRLSLNDMVEVTRYLSPHEVLSLATVARRFLALRTDNNVWHQQYTNAYPATDSRPALTKEFGWAWEFYFRRTFYLTVLRLETTKEELIERAVRLHTQKRIAENEGKKITNGGAALLWGWAGSPLAAVLLQHALERGVSYKVIKQVLSSTIDMKDKPFDAVAIRVLMGTPGHHLSQLLPPFVELYAQENPQVLSEHQLTEDDLFMLCTMVLTSHQHMVSSGSGSTSVPPSPPAAASADALLDTSSSSSSFCESVSSADIDDSHTPAAVQATLLSYLGREYPLEWVAALTSIVETQNERTQQALGDWVLFSECEVLGTTVLGVSLWKPRFVFLKLTHLIFLKQKPRSGGRVHISASLQCPQPAGLYVCATRRDRIVRLYTSVLGAKLAGAKGDRHFGSKTTRGYPGSAVSLRFPTWQEAAKWHCALVRIFTDVPAMYPALSEGDVFSFL